MTMRENIENLLKISCDDVDLREVYDIEFYVRQLRFFGCYIPDVISAHEMTVKIPFADAKKLKGGKVELQFAFTDFNGNPRASDVVTMNVDILLKEVGYDPVRD